MHDNGVRRDPVALGEHDHVAAHNVTAGDADALAVTNHQRTRAGEVAQGLQHVFGARLLHDGDDNRDRREYEEQQRLAEIAEREIDRAAGQQQQQHRLAQHVEDQAHDRAPARMGQFVEAFGLQPGQRLGCGQGLHGQDISATARPAAADG